MTMGLVGRKVGMTRIFTDEGDSIPVTVLDVSENRVSQLKSADVDGYVAVQVVFGKRRATRVTKPEAGHYAKAGVEAGSIIREFRVTPEEAAAYAPGAAVGTELFKEGQKVDVVGTTIGKGFAGRSNATTSARTVRATATRSRRVHLGRSVRHRIPDAFSQARRCRATSAPSVAPRRA